MPSDGPFLPLQDIRSLGRAGKEEKSGGSAWFNYAFAMDDFHGGISVAAGNPLFPDTTIWYSFSGTWSRPWVHRVMNVLHPAALTPFTIEAGIVGLDVNPAMPFYIDSVGLYCTYRRKTPNNVVDTLIFDFIYDPIRYFISSTNTQNNFNADTIFFYDLLFSNPPAEVFDNSHVQRHRVVKLLTWDAAADSSSNGVWYLSLNTSSLPPVTPHPDINTGLVAVSIRFSPGFSWTPQMDTLHNKNVFRVLFYEERGTSTFPLYFDGEYNGSGVFQTSSKFNSSSGWYGLHIPTYARTSASFGLEHLLIEYKIRGLESSLPQVSQNVLRAWNQGEKIWFSLPEGFTACSLRLTDCGGRPVLQRKDSWEGSYGVDVSSLAKGLYLAIVETDQGRQVARVVVH
ncbi:MAG: T9SS type A sorting domain-containing protein [Flavobacteriales bacterium]|nr:T9SS type A sorting domain-containing protein [Flavobacteriales bacterium]MDW8409881.1 T9SS type A sorting domain-containing protein [Flavobacteriales bacterium]